MKEENNAKKLSIFRGKEFVSAGIEPDLNDTSFS
jgi:hypothetical protein